MTGRRLTSGERQQIRCKKHEGLSVQQLARMFKRSSQTISRALQEVRALSAASAALPSAPVGSKPSDSTDQPIVQPSLALRVQLPSQKSTIPRQVPGSAVVDGRIAGQGTAKRTTRAASSERRAHAATRPDTAQIAGPARASVRAEGSETPTGNTSAREQMPVAQPSITVSTNTTKAPSERNSRKSSTQPREARQELPVAASATVALDRSTTRTPSPPPPSTQATEALTRDKSGRESSVASASTAAINIPAPASTSVLVPAVPASAVTTESNPSGAPIIRPFVRPPRVLPFVRSVSSSVSSSSSSGSNATTTANATAVAPSADSAAARQQDPGLGKRQKLQRIVASLQDRVRNLQQEQVGDDGGKLCDLLARVRDEVLDLDISTAIGDRKRKRDEDADNIELGKLLREKIVAEVGVLRAQAERERVQLARDRLEAQVEAALSRKRLEAASVSKATTDRILANAMVV